jgi:hypothetical protein
MGFSARRIIMALTIGALLAFMAVSVVACGESTFAYSGAWADEKNPSGAMLLIEPDGSEWIVRDIVGGNFRYAAKDDGLVCISAAPVTLTPSGDKLIIKYPGGYRMTLVRQDKVPSPWPTNEGPTGARDGALDGV